MFCGLTSNANCKCIKICFYLFATQVGNTNQGYHGNNGSNGNTGYSNTPNNGNNQAILRIGFMGRCQKVPKFDFQSHLKNINLGAHFLLLTFFDVDS